MELSYIYDTDVLVIGGGGAGIKAAIKAGEQGVSVLLCTKYKLGFSGASFYPGMDGWGINAITHRRLGDSEDNFYDEILSAGAGAVDKKLARVLVEQCTPAFRELEDYGIQFDKDENGEYNSVISCFGKRVRGANAKLGDIKQALWRQLMKNGVQIRSGISVVSLVMKDGVCCGALGFDELEQLAFFRAKSTVLATGGGCGLYRYSLATPDQTGDGYIMALDCGARLVNLEFLQFIPGLTWPVPKLLFQEKNLDTLPKVTNRTGREFLYDYLPEGVSLERCLVERARSGPFSHVGDGRYFDIALYEEWLKGNVKDNGGIHMQYDKRVLEDRRWPIVTWLEWMHSRGVHPTEEGFDMIPHAQCFNGGIYIDVDAGTGIPGLFAAGETAGGPHGADRLGGNAQAATQVFGNIAGVSAARFAKRTTLTDIEENQLLGQLRDRFDRGAGGLVEIEDQMREVREIMWTCGAVVRSEERCREGIARLSRLEERFNPYEHFATHTDVRRTAGLYSYLKLSQLMLRIMEQRKESRGPHFRADYPETNPEFEGSMIAQRDGEEIKLTLKRQD